MDQECHLGGIAIDVLDLQRTAGTAPNLTLAWGDADLRACAPILAAPDAISELCGLTT